jgi:hypothetical protein
MRTSISTHRNKRGVAMLLVIISMMMATVLTTAYLASRDNSAAIGENVASAAAARWAADSGLEFGLAILQTESTWRTGHSAGRLLLDYPLAGGTLNLDLLDLETNQAPDLTTEYLRMTATAVVDGVEQSAIANCRVPLVGGSQADVDLSEFSVFANDQLRMDNDATIARWPNAPLSSLGYRVFVGTNATAAASIDLNDMAASVDTTVYHGPGASGMLVSVVSGQVPEAVGLLDPITLPASPASGVAGPPASSTAPVLTMTGGAAITSANIRWKSAELRSNAVRTMRGNITVVTDQDLRINTGAKMIIDGNVKVVVWGDLVMDTGSIELKAGAKLTLFVRGDGATAVDLKDAYIGNIRADTTRDATGRSPYMDPERALVFSMPASSPLPWLLDRNTVVKASVYAPDASGFTISQQSAVYGRVASRIVTMTDDAAIFYDASLNDRVGYCYPDSALWDTSNRLKNEFKTLASLDGSLLQAIADTTNTVISALTKSDPTYKPASSPSTSPTVGPTDPTPRPIEVDYELVTFGNALDAWE